MKHIKTRKQKGQHACLEYYNNLRITENTDEFNLQASLMPKYKPLLDYMEEDDSNPPPSNKRPREDNEPDTPEADNEGFSDPESEDLGQFSDTVLPKSNSLKGNSCFATQIPAAFKASSSVSQENLDNFTFPSKKLFPPISYDTILAYAKRKAMFLEASRIQSKMEQAIAEDDLHHEEQEQEDDNEVERDNQQYDDEHSQESPEEADWDTGDEGSVLVEQPEALTAVPVVGDAEEQGTFFPQSYLEDRLKQESEDRLESFDDLPKQTLVHLQLLQLQEKHKLSFAAYEDILSWAQFATNLDPTVLQKNFPPRKAMIKKYRENLGLKDGAFEFKETIVQWLPDNKPLVIHRRPFLDCIYELLTKESLLGKDSENISLPHDTNPFASQPDKPPKFVSELHHGTWWRKTMKSICTGPTDILCPIAFEVDETFLDKNGRITVTPFNVKVLLFNTDTCTTKDASTTWFFLPNDEAEAAHHEKKTEAHHKIQNLHNALRECFKDLKHIMDSGEGIPWILTYNGVPYRVHLKFAVAFIISDTAMHDKLCCHYGVRNQKVKSICRHCNVATDHLSSYREFMKCKMWDPLNDLDPDVVGYDPKYWQSISHYPVKNALDELYHGSNKSKTHLNTCGEVLHMHQKGAMVRVVQSIVFSWRKGKNIELDSVTMSKKQKNINSSLDNLNFVGHQMGAFLNRQSDRDKPRTKFKNSLFVTTKKCAHEQAGVLMCILLSLLTDRGRQICLEERTMREEWVENMVYMLELILMVEVWLKKHSYPREHVMDPTRLSKAFQLYIDRLNDICPRDGMGNNLIKNHLMFHVPQYIQRWGPPRNVDSSGLERSHKTEAKRPAQLTQQRPETFMSQLADRYCDLRLVKRFREYFKVGRYFNKSLFQGTDEVEEQPGDNEDSYPVTTGSPFELGIDLSGKAGVKWKKRPGRQTHLQSVMDTVAEVVVSNIATGIRKVVEGFTEYKAKISNEVVIFRAHPSYRSASRQQRDVWYDWAYFDLADQGIASEPIPGQILMFIHVPFLQDQTRYRGVTLVPNQPHAVVRLFEKPPRDNFRQGQVYAGSLAPYSYLVKFGKTRDHFHIIPCQCIHSPTIVVPNLPMKPPKLGFWQRTARRKNKRKKLDEQIAPLGNGYFVFAPKKEWGESFGRLIESFPPTSRQR